MLGQAAEVTLVSGGDESAGLWATAFSGQWGHKQPAGWPPGLPPGTRTLGLRRDGTIVGVCRFSSATGMIAAPGLIAGYRDEQGYLSC
ncbi:MAG TPA: hypothetical protein VN840_11015 [Streptosporangiaceae bacterium]|nr:hypothetical protein [Streptosporangiaceae bacterium]